MPTNAPFTMRISVRSYELDALGHVNQAVYHSYAELARIEAFAAAGYPMDDLGSLQAAPVLLESHIVFRRELRARDTVDITCVAKFGTGRTFLMESVLTKADGQLSAEVSGTLGIMDLAARKLLADPRGVLEAAGVDLRRLTVE